MLLAKRWISGLLIVAASSAVGFAVLRLPVRTSAEQRPDPRYVTSGKFTTSQPSLRDEAKEYFDSYPTEVQQPITFPHKVHLKNGLQCEMCHSGVTQGPVASIPSVTLCMTCHQVIATKKPEIKKLAAYYKKGEDVPWQRVYWFYPSAHVSFWHAPHIRAGVDCKSCHGDMRQQTVAMRKTGLTMGFCLNCHTLRHAPTDCNTCHY